MDKLSKDCASLPPGTIVCRTIRGKKRFYHQWREDGKTLSRYLKAEEVLPLRQLIERRKQLIHQRKSDNHRPRKLGTGPKELGTGPKITIEKAINEASFSANKLKRRSVFGELLSFLRNNGPSRILIIKGPSGSGKTTLVRQFLGALSSSERAGLQLRTADMSWPAGPVHTVELAPMRYAEFELLFPKRGLTDFLQRGGLPGDVYSDFDTTREYIESQIGETAWETLRTLTNDFVIESLRPYTTRSHGRSRAHSDVQKVYQHLVKKPSAQPDPEILRRLEQFGLVQKLTVETLRPDFSRKEATVFVHPGLRHALSRRFIYELLEEESFASLGAAERKILRETVLSDTLEHALEECVTREARNSCRNVTRTAVAIKLPSGRHALVIADREELVCEMIVVRNDEKRHDDQIEELSDYRILDAVEHRYGLITGRVVLYRGRNAMHPLGISYRNVEDFLKRMPPPQTP